jgi:hypothetical protein
MHCRLLGKHQYFWGTYCLHLQSWSGCVGKQTGFRTPAWTFSPFWELKISHELFKIMTCACNRINFQTHLNMLSNIEKLIDYNNHILTEFNSVWNMRATNYMHGETCKAICLPQHYYYKNYALGSIQNTMYCKGSTVSVLTRDSTIYYNLAVDVNMTCDVIHKALRLSSITFLELLSVNRLHINSTWKVPVCCQKLTVIILCLKLLSMF